MNRGEKENWELFFEMEKDYDLFSLHTKGGFPAWDIIRPFVWNSILHNNYKEVKYKTSLFSKMRSCFRLFYSIIRLLKSEKGGTFFFGASRFLKMENKYFDPYFEKVKRIISEKYIFFESNTGKSIYSERKIIFNISPYYVKIMAIMPFRHKEILEFETLKIIQTSIEKTFSLIISEEEINSIIADFYWNFRFYNYLFKLKVFKRVLLHQNGHQKGLILAAKRNKIPVFEFQHGDIVDSTLVYNYGPNLMKNVDSIIAPDFFLTYAEIWTNNLKIPAKCIEIGSCYIESNINEKNHSNGIVVISSKEHEEELGELVSVLAQFYPKVTFYYKLHPAQFINYEMHLLFFINIPNVKVVGSERSIEDLSKIVSEFLAIYSTAIFEALQAGKIIYIYKRLNYKSFKSFFSLPQVFLFDNLAEFVQKRNIALESIKNIDPPQFFKLYNEQAFISALESKL